MVSLMSEWHCDFCGDLVGEGGHVPESLGEVALCRDCHPKFLRGDSSILKKPAPVADAFAEFELLGTRDPGRYPNRLFQCCFCYFWFCPTDAEPGYIPPRPGLKMCIGCSTAMRKDGFLVGYERPFSPRKI